LTRISVSPKCISPLKSYQSTRFQVELAGNTKYPLHNSLALQCEVVYIAPFLKNSHSEKYGGNMPFANYASLLNQARAEKYALGAFNVMNLIYLNPILEAAEIERAPVILQINPIHYKHSEIMAFIPYLREMALRATVPVALNLDHGRDFGEITAAVRYGFPSVMFDGSRLTYAENLAQTRRIVEICHPLEITVEAELGKLNDEGVEITTETRAVLFTDPDAAGEFVSQTGVDALAVSIGNAHGFYKGTPKLDFARLAAIREQADLPLVLHGGSGIPDADIRRAISMGIAKINIYTEMGASAHQRLREFLIQNAQLKDFATSFDEIREAIKTVVREKMQLFGSSGKV
jgi:fructose-bisphosphate aldolase class II